MDKTTDTKVSFRSDNVAKCMCPECPVFSECNLSTKTPVGYYCRDSFAK
jgi:hypothetical protein